MASSIHPSGRGDAQRDNGPAGHADQCQGQAAEGVGGQRDCDGLMPYAAVPAGRTELQMVATVDARFAFLRRVVGTCYISF